MADFFPADELEKRQFGCRSGYYFNNATRTCVRRNNSAWYYWGRWVLAGILVLIFVLVLCALGCCSSRRRKKKGAAPMYGTGWMANGYNPQPQYGQQQAQYGYGQQQGQYGQPPAYGHQQQGQYQNPQYTGQTYNPNDGYYAGQNEGIQLQQPQNAYAPRGADNDYAPPSGPPPGKVA